MTTVTCVGCGYTGEPITSQSGKHIRADCRQCGRYIKFLGQGGEPSLHFGQYNGKTLKHIAATDPGYLRWLLTKTDLKAKLRKQIEEVLA